LLFLSGLEKRIKQNTAYTATWLLATDIWEPEMRYQAPGSISREQAQSLLDATIALLPLL
jgi:hypothetical protein